MIYCEVETCTNNINGKCGLPTIHLREGLDEWAVCDEYEDYREAEE